VPHPLTDIPKAILCLHSVHYSCAFHASTNKCTQLSFNSQLHSKNIQFLHVSKPAGPPPDSRLHCSIVNTTNRPHAPLTYCLIIPFATQIQSTRKNPTNSSTYATDQISFSNCFTQQKLMYYVMMKQDGPKHLEV